MSGLRSRGKGVRVELAIAKLIGARKVSRAYQAGHDLELPLGDDRMLRIECKARADRFRECTTGSTSATCSSSRVIAGSRWWSCGWDWRAISSTRVARWTLPPNAGSLVRFRTQWPYLYSIGESRISAAPAWHAGDCA